ncbi:copper amine oxidase N-terminal domain-containing protein [Cohnella panacarvi]|uniref:copper amine oxidase N-terminal domain-containing protein n=1 Tax=Cohnella panacarvi TaxID=400776 RepID=UPI00047C22CF|nr:copper amine oxidase N-terminal domain-containing protein [Cohnella panacarvi]
MFKKSTLSTALAIVVLGSILSNTVSAEPGKDLQMIPVIVNGLKVKFPDTEPYINTDGRTMVPVRFVSEKLGAEVKWEVDTQTAVIDFKGKIIRMPVGSNLVTVDGQTQELDTAAEFQDGRTMVPLRFVSEVLGSNVEWDEPAHSVRVTDAEYQAKVDSGKVKLDLWGREYSKTQDDNWIRLADLESTKLYELYDYNNSHGNLNNRHFIEHWGKYPVEFKEIADKVSDKIRGWYEVQLNIDYRTINEDKLIKAFLDNASGTVNGTFIYDIKQSMKKYVAWVKQNKVVAKGYADPEMSAVYRSGDLLWVPTHFKFMIISANDPAQTFYDNWNVSRYSDSFKLKKGVWYDGYSQVSLSTNVANSTWGKDFGLRHGENMFTKGYYFYNITKE